MAHKISWLNQPGYTGESLNPIRARYWVPGNLGTERVGTHCEKCQTGCVNCWAEAHNRRCLPGGGTGLSYTRESRDKVQMFLDADKLNKPLHRKKPRCIFWCSMTDLFGAWVSNYKIRRCLEVMEKTPQHRHIILTKRWGRAASLLGLRRGSRTLYGQRKSLDIAWLLASASNQSEAEAAINHGIDGLSLEPLLGPIEFVGDELRRLRWLRWVLVGCESGPRRRPCKMKWVGAIVQQCQDAGVAVYVKQITMSFGSYVSHDPFEWPDGLQVQQFPEV